MTCEASPSVISSPASVAGPTQPDLLDGQTTAHSGPDHAPASRSRSRAKEPVPTTNGTCGPTSFASSVPPGPLSSWESRLRERLAMVGSTECALIWREKTTPAGASISRLAPWTPPISDSGSTGAPSKTVWPTPDTSLGGPDPVTRSTGLSVQTYMARAEATWSTPQASDGEKGGPNMSFGSGGQPLPAQMHGAMKAQWVTPSARDWKDSAGMSTTREDGTSRIDLVPRQMIATALHGQTPPGSPATTAKSAGSPNPAFPCWLMGYPPEWLSGADSVTPSSRKKPRK